VTPIVAGFGVAKILLHLGGVEKLADPQADGTDVDKNEVAIGGFVVVGCQPSGIPELVRAALDHVAQGTNCCIDGHPRHQFTTDQIHTGKKALAKGGVTFESRSPDGIPQRFKAVENRS
jgi:hypothetical protein